MLKVYTYRTDHGAGDCEFSLMLDDENMPICFDTIYDWAMAHLKPIHRHLSWKLVSEELADEKNIELNEKNG